MRKNFDKADYSEMIKVSQKDPLKLKIIWCKGEEVNDI